MRQKRAECPSCRKMLDASTALDGSPKAPKQGDVSLCAYCGLPLRYNLEGNELVVRELTKKDAAELPFEILKKIGRVQQAIIAKAHPKVGNFRVDPDKVPTMPGECDRCGRAMQIILPDAAFRVPRVELCPECIPKALQELKLPEKSGDPVVYPRDWARAKKAEIPPLT